MKKVIYSVVMFLSVGFIASAQDHTHAANENSSDPNAPEISFEKDVHDFGTIDYGGNGVYIFKFTNSGKNPLIISNAAGSCGCTVPEWPKEPIKKGESSGIKVSYDTKRPGPFTKTVTITSNAKSATKTITIKGVVQTQEESNSTVPLNKTNGSPVENPQSK